MINIAASVYPNGVEKFKRCYTTHATDERAMEMLKDGATPKFVSMKTGISVNTIVCWKRSVKVNY
jgi:uncharacterized protein YerC